MMKNFTKLTAIACMLIAILSMNAYSQSVNVTFQVDMQEQTVSLDGVHIAGSFQGWDPGATPMSNFIGDIYTYTYSGMSGEYIEFKYVNGIAWGQDENVPAQCAQNNNRYLTLPSEDTILVVRCFGKCVPCVVPQWDITFQVDMSNETVSPNGVHVAGTFNGWDPDSVPLVHQGNDVYAVTLQLGEGEYHEFKYINGNAWGGDESVPPECATNNNRTFTVPDHDSTLVAVCFGSCDPCTTVTDINVTFRVDMSDTTVVAEGVHIAGSMQGWDPAGTLLTDLGNGIWEHTFTLQSGTYHEYKFVNGIAWGQDEIVPWYCNQNNNRYLTVPQNDTILPAVCYGSCLVCNPTPVDVTFQVDMSLQFVSPDGVHIAGSFQGWDPAATPMTDMGGNIYEVTLTVGEGEFHEYKFINGNHFDYAENVAPECANYSGNREFFVPSTATTLDLVCFGECEPCQVTLYTFNLKVMLEGPFNGTDMNTDLYDAGVVPVNQPYNVEPWNYDGQEAITAPPDADIVDWLYIQMRETSGDASTAIPDSLLDHQAAVFLADGTVATPDGNPNFYYTGDITENLYIVIYHRNHLSVMSATPLVEIFGTFAYDFTTGLSQAYLDGHKLLGGGIYGMIGGDSDASGTINITDKDMHWSLDAGDAGYYQSDLNLDTQVNNPDKNDIWDVSYNESTTVPDGFDCGDNFIDSRDGQSYSTVQIGTQCWMAENLDLGAKIDGVNDQTDNAVYEKYCYDDLEINCDIYGGLYQWDEMMQYLTTEGTQGICPPNWHLPTDEEWKQLEGEVDSFYSYPDPEWDNTYFRGIDAGFNLKSTIGWSFGGNGADLYGFFVLPGGVLYGNVFGDIDVRAYLWTSTESESSKAYDRELSGAYFEIGRFDDNKDNGRSVRCLQN